MHLLITGSSGVLGSALIPFLQEQGHTVSRLIRSSQPASSGTPTWQPEEGTIDLQHLKDVDAVVHLAGESISKRWTPATRKRIHASRGPATQLLCSALSRLERPPQVMVSASAIGYYGDRKDEVLSEESASGAGFLAQVCREWEAATEPANGAGIRVVNLRLGIVLCPQGGALSQMLLPFRLGLGGPLGHGQQFWSWLSLDDAIGMIDHCLQTPALQGAVNAVAPNPVRNREFTKILAHVLRRPAVLRAPTWGLRMALGTQQANELLLFSTRVDPAQLKATHYSFRHPTLESALRHLL